MRKFTLIVVLSITCAPVQAGRKAPSSGKLPSELRAKNAEIKELKKLTLQLTERVRALEYQLDKIRLSAIPMPRVKTRMMQGDGLKPFPDGSYTVTFGHDGMEYQQLRFLIGPWSGTTPKPEVHQCWPPRTRSSAPWSGLSSSETNRNPQQVTGSTTKF